MASQCSKCGRIYWDESELAEILIVEEEGREVGKPYVGQDFEEGAAEVAKGCGECMTDQYLSDLDEGCDFATHPDFSAVPFQFQGLKCDNPECDYQDKTIPVENFIAWVNRPCPKCGSNLLTQADYENVQTLLYLGQMMLDHNEIQSAQDGDSVLSIHIDMDGSGKMSYSIDVDGNAIQEVLDDL